MSEMVRDTLLRVNARLAGLLEAAKLALRGEGDFSVDEVRALRQPVEQMAPIVAEAGELRRLRPELAGQLELYKSNLGDLQTTLEQIRIMLLARQASLEAGRAQLCAVSQWVTAFRQTR